VAASADGLVLARPPHDDDAYFPGGGGSGVARGRSCRVGRRGSTPRAPRLEERQPHAVAASDAVTVTVAVATGRAERGKKLPHAAKRQATMIRIQASDDNKPHSHPVPNPSPRRRLERAGDSPTKRNEVREKLRLVDKDGDRASACQCHPPRPARRQQRHQPWHCQARGSQPIVGNDLAACGGGGRGDGGGHLPVGAASLSAAIAIPGIRNVLDEEGRPPRSLQCPLARQKRRRLAGKHGARYDLQPRGGAGRGRVDGWVATGDDGGALHPAAAATTAVSVLERGSLGRG